MTMANTQAAKEESQSSKRTSWIRYPPSPKQLSRGGLRRGNPAPTSSSRTGARRLESRRTCRAEVKAFSYSDLLSSSDIEDAVGGREGGVTGGTRPKADTHSGRPTRFVPAPDSVRVDLGTRGGIGCACARSCANTNLFL